MFSPFIHINPISFSLQFGSVQYVFLKIITPATINTATIILLSLLLILLLFAFLILNNSKQIFIRKKKLSTLTENLIAGIIIGTWDNWEEDNSSIIRLKKILHKKDARNYVINQLEATINNLSGAAKQKVQLLYNQLNLKQDSLKKIHSRKWNIKTKGIIELYTFGQTDMIHELYKNVDSHNEIIRMEAQIGIINLLGFKGLNFLDSLTYPLTEWQQLKILEQLAAHTEDGQLSDNLSKWLLSANDSVVLIALRFAEIFQKLHFHNEVLHCLTHTNARIRSQAIETLLHIANETTANELVNIYNEEIFSIKIQILKAISAIGNKDQFDFLLTQLSNENDMIKLYAARALTHCFKTGLTILEEKGKALNTVYEKIYLHIKKEMLLN